MNDGRDNGAKSILFTWMLVVSLVVVITSVVFTILLIQYRTKDLLEQTDARLLSAAEFNRELLGLNYHDRINDKTSVSEEEFRAIVARNDDLCRRLDLQYLWSVLVMDDGRLVFTSAAHSDINDPNSPRAAFFETHHDPESFAPALNPDLKPSFSTFNNEWGQGRMVLVPREDALGRTYIFGASVQLTELNAMIRQTTITSIGIGLVVFCGVFLISLVLARSFAAPIIGLTAAAEQMATGDLDVPLVPGGTRELQSLTHSLDRMRQGLKQLLEEIRQSEERYSRIVNTATEGIWAMDQNHKTTFVNPGMANMLGYSVAEMMGQPVESFMFTEDLVDHESKMQARHQGQASYYERRFCCKDGSSRWTIVSGVPLTDKQGNFIGSFGMFTDITARKQAEEQLKTALKEKDVLLQELYHRTKNNMNVISSLLSLQSAYLRDEQALSIFADMQHRIHAMAMVHQKLYQSKNLTSIDLKEYIDDLAEYLLDSYNASLSRITLHKELESVPVLIDTAMPCGLVLNELISNACKHAFPNNRPGEIRLGLRQSEGGKITLQIVDNGVGVPAGFDFRQADSLGLKTAVAIVEYQLQGCISFITDNGVACQIQFEDTLYRPRV